MLDSDSVTVWVLLRQLHSSCNIGVASLSFLGDNYSKLPSSLVLTIFLFPLLHCSLSLRYSSCIVEVSFGAGYLVITLIVLYVLTSYCFL